jgi:hypothetical protein
MLPDMFEEEDADIQMKLSLEELLEDEDVNSDGGD